MAAVAAILSASLLRNDHARQAEQTS